MFTGREAEVRNVITFLLDEKKAVVSLHGGPGFGKTAIAIEASYKLREDHNIPVVFSQLTTATNEDEMVRQLCLDVGVNYEDDPKQSLMFWLKNIKRKEILVLDDVDNLLENETSFYEFVRLLRKNSNQQCQIVTTSRTSFEIPNLSTHKVQLKEMDDEACVEFLKKQSPQQDEKFLRRLAELCGNITLAMCIAGSRIHNFKDSDKLLQHLESQPMKTLKRPNRNEYVNRAIDMSYEKCSKEEQQTLVRFSVFVGSFSEDAARDVIEKKNLETTRIIEKLVSLNLMKQETDHRYSIHLLIKHFLKDKQKGKDEKAQRAHAEAMRAEVLMIEHYLELADQLTMKSYSKDGYKDNREALKREAANIHNVLKICCQQEDLTNPDISDCLVRSKIYTTSARFFSLFVRTIIPGSIVEKFLQRCAKVAENKNHTAIKIDFDCLLAERERSKTIGKNDEHQFTPKMERIMEEFETHYEELKENKSLCAQYYYQLGKYLSRKSESQKGKQRLNLRIQAREQLEKSLELRKTLTGTSEEKADNIFSLLQLGKNCRNIGTTQRQLRKLKASKKSFKKAEEYYKEAIQLSQDNLGDHDLTLSCHKNLGELFLNINEHDLAEKEYITAKQMWENLGLDASERYVFLLNNLGTCLKKSNRANEAIQVLEEARDMAEKLAEDDEPNNCKAKVYTSLATAYSLGQKSTEAVHYANKAIVEFRKIENRSIPEWKYPKSSRTNNSLLKTLENIVKNFAKRF